MRFFLVIAMLISITSCIKKQRIVNRLEGTWKHEKLLIQDGTYIPLNTYFKFSGGKADGKTFLPLTVTSDTAITDGSYLVSKKGDVLYLKFDNTKPDIDTCFIEDMDKKMLIYRNFDGINFVYKQ